MYISDGVGERLKEERERLGFSQTELGLRLGVSRGTQKNYELGANSLDLRYVAALAEHGVDSTYILTGLRSSAPGQGFSSDETELVDLYRRLPDEDRKTIRRIVRSMAAEADQAAQ